MVELYMYSLISEKLKQFELETNEKFNNIAFPTKFIHRFIHWMNLKGITKIYMQEYIDPENFQRHFEIGSRLKTIVSEEGESNHYVYDAKHISNENVSFDGMTRDKVIEFLQNIENDCGKELFNIKYQIRKTVGLNAYNFNKIKKQKNEIPYSFPVKN